MTMNQFRLHIDIPLGTNEEDAISNAKSIMRWHFNDIEAREKIQRLTYDRTPLTEVNYRLGHDDDRQRSNYLDINENDHVSTRKSKISFVIQVPEEQEKFDWVD